MCVCVCVVICLLMHASYSVTLFMHPGSLHSLCVMLHLLEEVLFCLQLEKWFPWTWVIISLYLVSVYGILLPEFLALAFTQDLLHCLVSFLKACLAAVVIACGGDP